MKDRGSSRSRHKTLRVQADIAHTFGPLLVPLAILLIFCGGYELVRSFAHPLETDAANILTGSAVLALGLLLSSFLLRSVRIFKRNRIQTLVASEGAPGETRTRLHGNALSQAAPPPRPFHRFYVDETRVSR
jgi:hypothetical protein